MDEACHMCIRLVEYGTRLVLRNFVKLKLCHVNYRRKCDFIDDDDKMVTGPKSTFALFRCLSF